MLLEPQRLSARIAESLDNADPADLLLATISLVEVGTLAAKGRLQLPVEADRWIEQALVRAPVSVVPLTEEIARAAANLPRFNHYDPADRVIVATSLIVGANIVTADRTIQSYKEVTTVW